MKNTLFGAISLSLAASIWGGMYVVSKHVLNFVPPITLVWSRYMIAFIVLFTILKLSQAKSADYQKVRKKDWLLIGWIGFIGNFLSVTLQFIGTRLSNAHTGALITSATPAFILLFARIVLKEALTLRKIISLCLATLGVVIVIGWDINLATHFWGNISLVGAALTWALLSVYVKLAAIKYSSLTITTYAVLVALFLTTPLMFWELQTEEIFLNQPTIIFGILYLGIVSTALAFFLWNKGMELMDAGIGSLFFFFQPVVGSLLGWLILKEHLQKSFFVGGLFIVFGVLIITLNSKKSKKNLSYVKN